MNEDKHTTSNSTGLLWPDLKLCLVFMTRLPLRLDARTQHRSLAQACALLPLVGVVVGVFGAVVLSLAQAIGLPTTAAAAIAIAATILLTGALHEDGLADVADGFGGGLEKTRKLEIMRDSRIGSYGVIAIGLSLLLRVTLIADAAFRFESFWAITGMFVAMHVIARGLLPAVMATLPLARSDGLAAAAERPSGQRAGAAAVLSLLIAAVCLGPLTALAVFAVAVLGVVMVAWLARRQIGGYTGDVLGTAEQVAEITALAAITVIL